MKKYLLTSLFGLFAFVGFTNAITFDNPSGGSYSPSSFTVDEDFDFSDITSYSCDVSIGGACAIVLGTEGNEDYCFIAYENEFMIYDNYGGTCGGLPSGTYYAKYNDPSQVFQSITFGSSSSGGGGSSGGLLSGGTAVFSSLITSVGNTISEFIPYIVYLGLGILVSIVGFFAVKWLMNWTSAKIRGTFSSGKKRR